MSYENSEVSIEKAQPLELYKFSYNGIIYTYTSAQRPYTIGGFTYSPEYIHRSESLKLGTSAGAVETCTITVTRVNSIALLYQGAPPEEDEVKVSIYRTHASELSNYIKILDGVVSQVRFMGSEAELTITIENVLSRNVPKGTLSYFCQNCIYDHRCALNMDDYGLKCYIDERMEGLYIYSANLREKPSGYFTDGFIKMGNCTRQIKKHEDNRILLKYPINESDKQGSFMAYPGCSNLFIICARKFGNTDNFSGIPYQEPYDVYLHPANNRHAYWENGNIVYRDTHGKLHTMGLD